MLRRLEQLLDGVLHEWSFDRVTFEYNYWPLRRIVMLTYRAIKRVRLLKSWVRVAWKDEHWGPQDFDAVVVNKLRFIVPYLDQYMEGELKELNPELFKAAKAAHLMLKLLERTSADYWEDRFLSSAGSSIAVINPDGTVVTHPSSPDMRKKMAYSLLANKYRRIAYAIAAKYSNNWFV